MTKTIEGLNLQLQSLIRTRETYEAKLVNMSIDFSKQVEYSTYLREQIQRVDNQINFVVCNIERIESLSK